MTQNKDSAELSGKSDDQNSGSISRLIGLSIVTRLIFDTGVQVFNPFLPIIAAGLQTDVVTLGRMVSLRSAMGLIAPLFGTLADRRGFRKIMRFGLCSGALGALLVGLSNSLPMATVGMMVWGIGLAAFVPTLQAYLSAQLPYERRGRGIAIVEYSWALAGIVGLFSIGLLIAATSWRAPFYALSFGMITMAILFGRLPSARERIKKGSDPSNESAIESGQRVSSLVRRAIHFFSLGENARSAYATIIGSMFFFFAAFQVFIAHGAWLAAEYGLGSAQLGTIALLLGLADLFGSVMVSLITDRIGKRRSVLIGCFGALVGYLLMPIFNVSLALAVVGIAIARTSFEFAIVSNISLLSEQVPLQRGKVMTIGSAATLIGATIAGTSGPWLYTVYGVWGLSLVSAAFTALGIIIYLLWTKERA